MVILLISILLPILLAIIIFPLDYDGSVYIYVSYTFLLCYGLYFIIISSRTRKEIENKYHPDKKVVRSIFATKRFLQYQNDIILSGKIDELLVIFGGLIPLMFEPFILSIIMAIIRNTL